MHDDIGSLISPATWENNLQALKQADPPLAEQLAGWNLPDWIRPVPGRDGSPTFRLFAPDTDPQWFGRTSMPTVSGPALLEAFDPGDGNVLLPGIGQGFEMKQLTERLPDYRAVFILERRLEMIALALRLYDVSAPIRTGRLVFITGDDQADALARFLAEHPGYMAPSRLLGWPWMSPAEQQQSRLAVERAATLASQTCSQIAATLHAELHNLPAQPIEDPPRVVVLGLQPDQHTNTLAASLDTALEALGWPARLCTADRPEHVVTVHHAKVVLDHQPHWALLINHARGHYRDLFGQTPPMVSVLQGHLRLNAEFAKMVGPEDWVMAETAAQCESLVGWGLPADRVVHIGPAGDAAAFSHEHSAPDAQDLDPIDLAVIADGCDVSPAASGIRLPSHVALWEAVIGQIAGDVDHYWSSETDRYFERGAKASEIRLKEEQLRAELIAKISAGPGPTVLLLSWLHALIDQGVTVGLWGRGWESHSAVAGIWKGPIRGPAQLSTVYRSAAMTLLPDQPDPPGSPVYDATLAGTLVLRRSRTPSTGADKTSPASLPRFQRRTQLLNLVAGFLEDPRRIRDVLEPVRIAITRSACWTHRLQVIRDHLHAKVAAP